MLIAWGQFLQNESFGEMSSWWHLATIIQVLSSRSGQSIEPTRSVGGDSRRVFGGTQEVRFDLIS